MANLCPLRSPSHVEHLRENNLKVEVTDKPKSASGPNIMITPGDVRSPDRPQGTSGTNRQLSSLDGRVSGADGVFSQHVPDIYRVERVM